MPALTIGAEYVVLGNEQPSRTLMAECDLATISTPIACLRSIRHRQAEVVFPIHAARSVRLRRDRNAMLIDAAYQGQARKLLVEANRNGFLYVLDREDGKFLSAVPFVEKLTWARGIDSQGGRFVRVCSLPCRHQGVSGLWRRYQLVRSVLQRVHAFRVLSGARGVRNVLP